MTHRVTPFLLLLSACTAGTTTGDGATSGSSSGTSTSMGTTGAGSTTCDAGQVYEDAVVLGADLPLDSDSPHLTDAVLVDQTLVLVGHDVGGSGSVWAVDVADPDAPALVGSTGSRQIMGVCWGDDSGYALTQDGQLTALSLTEDGPVLGQSWPVGPAGSRLDCDGSIVAWGVGASGGGVAASGQLDDGWQSLSGDVRDVLIDGDTLWAVGYDGLSAWQLSSSGGTVAPVLLDTLELDASCTDLAAGDDWLVVGCGAAGISLIDRNDGHPQLLGRWTGHVSSRTVSVVGSAVLVSAWTEWLVIDASDPAQPTLVASQTAPSAASAAVPLSVPDGEPALVALVDWKQPSVATLSSVSAPELRLDADFARPGLAVSVFNDGTEGLCLDPPQEGSLSSVWVASGQAATWQLPEDLAEGSTVSLVSNDADEGLTTLDVGGLDGLVVGDLSPTFVETDLDGITWDLGELLGQVVFLGLLDST